MRTITRFPVRRLLAAFVMLVMLGGGSIGPARASAIPTAPLSRTLPNGTRVVVFPIHRLPIVQVQLVVPAGQLAEPSGRGGVAPLTATLLTHGTSSRDANTFENDAARIGGAITARASRDVATVNGAFLAADLGAGLELMSDAVINPVFDDDELKLERSRNQFALRQMRSDPATLAEEHLWSAAFGERPYGRSPFGTDSSLARLTRDDLRSFHRDHYRPDHAILVVAGDVDADSVFALATEWFGRWSGRSVVTTPAAGATPRERVRIIDVPDAPYSVLRLGCVVPGSRTQANLPLSLAISRFSGGAFSWLQQPSTRRRLGPLVTGSMTSFSEAGMFSFGTPVMTDSAGAVVRALRAILSQYVANSPVRTELETIRRAGEVGYLASLETLGGLMGQWTTMAIDGRPDDALRATGWRLANMTAAEIDGASARWLTPDSLVVVAVGPAKALVPQLSAFGPVRVVALPSGPPSAPPDTTVVTEASAARAREVITAALRAHGGEDSLRAIHDSIVRITASVGPQGSATTGEMTQLRKDPGLFSNVIRFDQLETRQVLNGNQGWSVTPGAGGVQDADSVQVTGMRASFQSDVPHVLLGLRRTGLRVAYRGTGKADQQTTDVVEVYTPEGLWQRYQFDARTHLLAGLDSYDTTPGISTQVLGRRYGNYQRIAGVQWPFREMRMLNGQTTMRMETQSVVVNSGIEGRQFERPHTGIH
jgi:predicted Zn-dependent peptidase